MSTARPIQSVKLDMSTAEPIGEQQEQPGFFRRMGQSLGVPTSKEELQQAITPVTVGGVPIAPKMSGLGAAIGYGQNVYDKAKELLEHPELGPAPRAVMSLTPGGASQQSFGEDIANKNYAGAAGTAAGVAGQFAAPELIDRAGNVSLSKATAPLRAAVRGANTALAKAPGSIGATAGYAVGRATGIPGAAEVGGAAGYALGKELLPQVQIPGAGVGLPNRVTGGPVTAPQYVPPRVAPAATGSISSRTVSLADLKGVLDQTLGVKQFQNNVPLRQQPDVIGTSPKPNLPEGHIPVESQKISSYKYDPEEQELHVRYTSGGPTYVYRGVEPEEVQYFEESKSKGRAIQGIEASHPYDKIVNGKRIQGRAATQDNGLNQGDDLTEQVTQTFPRR